MFPLTGLLTIQNSQDSPSPETMGESSIATRVPTFPAVKQDSSSPKTMDESFTETRVPTFQAVHDYGK